MSASDIRSPRLDALLSRVKRALTRQVWLFGAGSALLWAAAWLLFIYWADRLLQLPAPIRVFHTAILFGLPVYAVVRHLLRPLARIPDRDGLAILLERAHGDSRDLLVSAVQLAPKADQAPKLIERVVQEAEDLSTRLDPGRVVDPRGTRRRIGLAAATSVVTVAALAAQPALAGIFLQRMFGADVRWPQRTHLAVEIPAVGDRIQVEETDSEITVRAARGSDVPVLVRADGIVPREVMLHFDSGYKTPLTSGGTPVFRTLLRSVQEDLSFHVTGGDDEDGEPKVRVQVLQPPDVAGIAWAIEPPAYSGIEPSLVHAPDIEVLEGSRVRIFMRPDPVEATGVARLLPEDREVELERSPFPMEDGSEVGGGLSFEFAADLSLRISFELVDETGLPNPDPGLFGVTTIEDRRPEVLLLAPARADLDVVAGGAVPVRARIEDDFGLASLAWDVRSAQNPDEPLLGDDLTFTRVETPEAFYGVNAPNTWVAGTRLEVSDLGGEDVASVGTQVTLQVFATDNREPQANESPSAPVRLRVVSGDDYLRRLQDNLARAGEQANELYQLGGTKEKLTKELLAVAGGDEPAALEEGGLGDLSSLVHGVRRVQGDARALARELAALTEGLLYSRVDDRAGQLLDAIDQALAQHFDRGFHPEPWVTLAERYRAGALGQADLAGDLVEIVGLALEISERHTLEAADALTVAQEAAGPAATLAALENAVAAQGRAQAAMDQLLVKLGEWDNFQSVLTLTRDILNRQKNLNQRTRKYAEDK